MKSKVYPTPEAALDGLLFDGMSLMSGGFGLSGNPQNLILDDDVRARTEADFNPGRFQ